MLMERRLAVVVGFIGKMPYAGMSLYNIHYMAGLQELGYQVHYVERMDLPEECYDPATDAMTDDPQPAVNHLACLLPRIGIAAERFSFIDRANCCHGSGWPVLREALDQADFVLTLATPTWFDDLERCSRRAFIDGDPVFTQTAMLKDEPCFGTAPKHYDTLFTYGTRMGMPDCTVPRAGRMWIPTHPVVSTRLWNVASALTHQPPVTVLMHWAAGSDVTVDGCVYGHKNREFERFIELPRRTSQEFVLAVGGKSPRDRLQVHGWKLADPLKVTATIDAYKRFIAGSRADFGIAKHAYVASRSGWFSDRSTCYLASGRPVLHQDTGFTDWLPSEEGVLAFSDVDDVLEALKCLDADYGRHAQAARRIAEEYFEAATVIGRMLDDAGYR
jgi:hypothetical protein